MKYWEVIAENLKKAGWSLGYVSTLDASGRTIWIVDVHRDNGKRLVARSDEKLTTGGWIRSASQPYRCMVALTVPCQE
jgi:hypothetical protein